MTIIERDKEYIAGTYNRFPVEIESGKGSLVKDFNGKPYIDLGSGIAVTSFGINDEEWKQAVISQLSNIQHTSNLYFTEPDGRLAEMLCERTGMKKVFFSNSGAEANECAIKVARKYASEKHGKDCFTIVSLKNSFHGRTLATLAATGQDKFHSLFNPLPLGFESVEANNFEAFKSLCEKTKVAGVIVECIQGEGGVLPLEKDYLVSLRNYTKEKDIILIVDEVQTGNGRTGQLYSYMNFGIEPDVISTAKGLAGGLPLGATMMNEKTADVLKAGDHGSTFGGNPVCCAAACNILSRIDSSLLAEVRHKGRIIKTELEGMKGILSVDGMGLMVGLKTVRPAGEIVSECISKGVLCLTAHEKVRLLPALNIPEELLYQALQIIKETAADY